MVELPLKLVIERADRYRVATRALVATGLGVLALSAAGCAQAPEPVTPKEAEGAMDVLPSARVKAMRNRFCRSLTAQRTPSIRTVRPYLSGVPIDPQAEKALERWKKLQWNDPNRRYLPGNHEYLQKYMDAVDAEAQMLFAVNDVEEGLLQQNNPEIVQDGGVPVDPDAVAARIPRLYAKTLGAFAVAGWDDCMDKFDWVVAYAGSPTTK